MRLDKFYDIEACTNEKKLLSILSKLKERDVIQYKLIDSWTLQIDDYDLTHDEEMQLIDDFKNLGVYPSDDLNDNENDLYWGYDDFN